MTSSESPTHPDAPRAGGETPPMDIDETRDLLLHAAEVLRCHAADQSTASGIDCGCADVAHRLDALRAALLERHRDGERETVCGMRFVVDRTIPPGEIHMRQDGRVVARLINVTDGEVAVGSAPPSPERASK